MWKIITLIWNIRTFLSKIITLMWKIITFMSKIITLTWKIRTFNKLRLFAEAFKAGICDLPLYLTSADSELQQKKIII